MPAVSHKTPQLNVSNDLFLIYALQLKKKKGDAPEIVNQQTSQEL